MANTPPQGLLLKFFPSLQIRDIYPEHHTGDFPGTPPMGSMEVGIPPVQKVCYEVEGD